jgi:HK97 family phage prohead protease
MNTLNFGLELKEISDQGEIAGYGAVFNNVDEYGDRIVPGAFAKSLAKHTSAGSMPLMLWNHNPNEPIGVWTEMAEDKKGLRVNGKLILEVARAKEVYALLINGAMKGLSIGYRTVADQIEGNIRMLKELDLWEVSPVTFPANLKAAVTSVKSANMAEFARRLRDGEPPEIKEFEDILRDAGVPKTLATRIASVGYAKAIRSESEGKANENALRVLKEAAAAFTSRT